MVLEVSVSLLSLPSFLPSYIPSFLLPVSLSPSLSQRLIQNTELIKAYIFFFSIFGDSLQIIPLNLHKRPLVSVYHQIWFMLL
jgi:hypothetical protein